MNKNIGSIGDISDKAKKWLLAREIFDTLTNCEQKQFFAVEVLTKAENEFFESAWVGLNGNPLLEHYRK